MRLAEEEEDEGETDQWRGKTETERKFEEMRRKRVRSPFHFLRNCWISDCLQSPRCPKKDLIPELGSRE
jgi:hypothetical protein